MSTSLQITLRLLLIALPAIASSFLIFHVAQVSRLTWLVQGGAVLFMLLAALGLSMLRFTVSEKVVAILGAVGIALCAAPLLDAGAGPVRWVRVGGLSLYIAPVVIPVLLVVTALAVQRATLAGSAIRMAQAGVMMLAALAWVLAAQPDFAQASALTVAAIVLILCAPVSVGMRAMLALPFLLACVWASLQADPLQPVPHVEQVIRLAWTHSAGAGLWVTGAAAVLMAGPAWLLGRRHAAWLALPAYYAMLIAGSLVDMTPAPLMGYGAGPLLGFGLMAGLAAAGLAAEAQRLPMTFSESR